MADLFLLSATLMNEKSGLSFGDNSLQKKAEAIR